MKFIVVSGGVLSGLGKGVTTASIGLLLKSRGIRTTAVKCDMYLNIDAGTMNPLEHGEVFVTHDGLETDQDLGHYERFLNIDHTRVNYMTNGQIYQIILDRERALEYDGVCVQPYHHIPPEIIKRWFKAGKTHNSDVVLIELGGTVGEYEGLLFFESVRRLKQNNPGDVVLIHIGYLPAPASIGELKSKPVQQSVSQLNSLGLQPDFIMGRAEKPIDKKRKEKIALASGLSIEDIFSNHDLDSIYEVPLVLKDQKLDDKIVKKLKLKANGKDLKEWKEMLELSKSTNKELKIGMIGKYQKTGDYTLEDAYVCVVEALKHAAWQFGAEPKLVWINSEDLAEKDSSAIEKKLDRLDAILVPQGWGARGTEGKIKAAQYAREKNIPYLGLCFGMQMAAIEFARNVLGLKDANSEEVDADSPDPVIHVMPKQKEYLAKKQYGGTIRLGAWPAVLTKGSMLHKAYSKYGKGKDKPWHQPNPLGSNNGQRKTDNGTLIYERHRHRYEFNNKYREKFEKNGFIISATSPDGKLVEAVEITDHPFFVGTQYHPEYLSRPLSPHPIFMAFMKSVVNN